MIVTFLLLTGTGCKGGENTGTQIEQPTTMESTSCTTTSTTITTSTSTTSSTTTTSTETTMELTMEIVTIPMTAWVNTAPTEPVYVEPQTEYIAVGMNYSNNTPITDYERILLNNVVANEYGSDWVSVPEKAKVVAVVMNRVNSGSYPNTIEDVLTQRDQFSGYYACNYEWSSVTPSVREAVDYYFEHQDEFGSYTGFWGDGTYNHFY